MPLNKVFNKYQRDILKLSTTYRTKLLNSVEDSSPILKQGIEEFHYKSVRDWKKLEQCVTVKIVTDSTMKRESRKYLERQTKHFEKLMKLFGFDQYPTLCTRFNQFLTAPIFLDFLDKNSQNHEQILSFCEERSDDIDRIITEVSANFLTNHEELRELALDKKKPLDAVFISCSKRQWDELEKLIQGLFKT